MIAITIHGNLNTIELCQHKSHAASLTSAHSSLSNVRSIGSTYSTVSSLPSTAAISFTEHAKPSLTYSEGSVTKRLATGIILLIIMALWIKVHTVAKFVAAADRT